MEFIKKENGFIRKYLDDIFFDSLRNDYKEFNDWYAKSETDIYKSSYYWIDNGVQAFLALKIENESLVLNGQEILPKSRRLKIATIKSNPSLPGFSEFVIYQAMKMAQSENITEIYFSIIPNTDNKEKLLEISKLYGFKEIGKSQFSSDGNVERANDEIYICKNIKEYDETLSAKENYPQYKVDAAKIMIIEEEYHDNFLPDATLKNISSNFDPRKMGIKKAYISNDWKWTNVSEGTLILIYRKAMENSGNKSVITSIGRFIKTYQKGIDYKNNEQFREILKNNHAIDETKIESWFENNEYIVSFEYLDSFGSGNNKYNWRRLNDENIISGRFSCLEVSKENVSKIIKESKNV